jgi:predicted dehydrogenase
VDKELRVALIGFGLGGRVFHAPLITTTPGLRLTTIVTADAQRSAAASQAYPGARIVAAADWVWANAAEHDLVVITTANRAHVPLAKAAIAAGIAAVVDKPMARTPDEARALVAEAERLRVPLTV